MTTSGEPFQLRDDDGLRTQVRRARRRHATHAAIRTTARAAIPTLIAAAALALLGHERAATIALCVMAPTILVLAEIDAVAAARRYTRIREELELAAVTHGCDPDVTALVRNASAAPEDLLLATVAGLRRAAAIAQRNADAAESRARYVSSGIAEMFSQRVHAEEGLKAALAAELHDTVAQTLLTAQWTLEHGAPPDVALTEVRAAEDQLRAVMAQTRPPELDTDLATAVAGLIEEMRARHSLVVHVSAWPAADEHVPSAAALTIYRFYQEALANVAKHSGSTRAELRLSADQTVVATVTDHGSGFNVHTVRPVGGRHVGLKLLGDRARTLGGRTHVRSEPGTGTTVSLTLPTSAHTHFERRHGRHGAA